MLSQDPARPELDVPPVTNLILFFACAEHCHLSFCFSAGMLSTASQLLQSTPMTAAGDTLKLLRLTLTAQLKPADIEFAYLGNLAAVPPGEPLLDEEHAQCLEAVFQRMQHAYAADTGANHALTALTSLLLVIAFSWKLHVPCAM